MELQLCLGTLIARFGQYLVVLVLGSFPTRGGAAERPSIMPLLGSDASTRATAGQLVAAAQPKVVSVKISRYGVSAPCAISTPPKHASRQRGSAPPRGGSVGRRGAGAGLPPPP